MQITCETNGFSFEIAKWALNNQKILRDHIKTVKEVINLYLKI